MGDDGTGKNTYYSKKELAEEKYQKEKGVAEQLFSKLPQKESKMFYSLWLEYEKKECYEAKVVKALDALECMLQVLEYKKGEMFPAHLSFTVDTVDDTQILTLLFHLSQKKLLRKMKKKYKEFKK